MPRGTQIRWSGLEGYDRWPADDVASMQAVKQALDPKNILRGREVF
jgi:FAD/FMN-containing dehydrogenase